MAHWPLWQGLVTAGQLLLHMSLGLSLHHSRSTVFLGTHLQQSAAVLAAEGLRYVFGGQVILLHLTAAQTLSVGFSVGFSVAGLHTIRVRIPTRPDPGPPADAQLPDAQSAFLEQDEPVGFLVGVGSVGFWRSWHLKSHEHVFARMAHWPLWQGFVAAGQLFLHMSLGLSLHHSRSTVFLGTHLQQSPAVLAAEGLRYVFGGHVTAGHITSVQMF
jgi:hypothetical protein